MNEHNCKICKKGVGIPLIFKDFDMARSTSIFGMEIVINKLDEIIKLLWEIMHLINSKLINFNQNQEFPRKCDWGNSKKPSRNFW